MLSLAKRIIKQLLHDHRSMAIILIAPIFLISLLYLLLAESSYTPTIMVDEDQLPPLVIDELNANQDVIIIDKISEASDQELILAEEADAAITVSTDGITITMFEQDSVKTKKVTSAVSAAFAAINNQQTIKMDYLYGDPDGSTFDSLAYLLLAVLAFFFVFLVAGISFVRERTSHTLERLMRTPLSSFSVVTGYSIGFGIVAIIQSTILILFTRFVLNTPFIGEWWIATVIMLLIALVAVMCGILVSVVSKTEFQVVQFIPVLVIPQIFFSGLIPVDTLPYHLDKLSFIMPLFYGAEGLKGVMVYGYGFSEIWQQIVVLLSMSAFLFLMSIVAVNKYRRS